MPIPPIYTRPYVNTAFWYMIHGNSPEDTRARLRVKSPEATDYDIAYAVRRAREGLTYDQALQTLGPCPTDPSGTFPDAVAPACPPCATGCKWLFYINPGGFARTS
jgi:hypothetical protein